MGLVPRFKVFGAPNWGLAPGFSLQLGGANIGLVPRFKQILSNRLSTHFGGTRQRVGSNPLNNFKGWGAFPLI